MKNKELYNKTVDILVQAYFNNTLEHGNCAACAVGNIINYYRPFSRQEILEVNGDDIIRDGWSKIFCTYNAHTSTQEQTIHMEHYTGKAAEQINCTGYAVTELAKIEFAFETASKIGDYMFNGLMAVIDVLDRIHENTDEVATKETKSKFIKSTVLPSLLTQ